MYLCACLFLFRCGYAYNYVLVSCSSAHHHLISFLRQVFSLAYNSPICLGQGLTLLLFPIAGVTNAYYHDQLSYMGSRAQTQVPLCMWQALY